MAVDGAWDGLAASVTQNLHWMVLLQPETGRRYAPAGRRWIFPHPEGVRDHWTLFEWDAFFNALELAIESPELAWETAEAVLATQYPNGNVPNWRSRHAGTPDRSQPPVGAFAVLKLYLRTGDREHVARAFPALERWSAWWREERGGRPRRDGDASGLFEWGSHSEELQLCRENYDSRTGEGGGQRHQSWGPLFALLGIEEFADVTPWDGLRVGSLAPPPRSCLRRVPLLGRRWTITLGPQGLVLEADGRELLRSDRPVVLKRLRIEDGELTAEAVSRHGVALASAAAARRLPPGTHAVRLPLA